MLEILIATNNLGKVKEIKDILDGELGRNYDEIEINSRNPYLIRHLKYQYLDM